MTKHSEMSKQDYISAAKLDSYLHAARDIRTAQLKLQLMQSKHIKSKLLKLLAPFMQQRAV